MAVVRATVLVHNTVHREGGALFQARETAIGVTADAHSRSGAYAFLAYRPVPMRAILVALVRALRATGCTAAAAAMEVEACRALRRLTALV